MGEIFLGSDGAVMGRENQRVKATLSYSGISFLSSFCQDLIIRADDLLSWICYFKLEIQ